LRSFMPLKIAPPCPDAVQSGEGGVGVGPYQSHKVLEKHSELLIAFYYNNIG